MVVDAVGDERLSLGRESNVGCTSCEQYTDGVCDRRGVHLELGVEGSWKGGTTARGTSAVFQLGAGWGQNFLKSCIRSGFF